MNLIFLIQGSGIISNSNNKIIPGRLIVPKIFQIEENEDKKKDNKIEKKEKIQKRKEIQFKR